MIDSHCHLDFSEFQVDFELIRARAAEAGVTKLLTISTKLAALEKIAALSEKYPEIYHSVGVHPCEIQGDQDIPAVEKLVQFLRHPKAVGLGETGLDFYHSHAHVDSQKESFINHIKVSLETGIPLIIHSREAEEAILEVLGAFSLSQKPGVIHCFTGTEAFAQKTMERGFFISFSGILTFKNAKILQDIAKKIPLEKILIETDAPYLAPHPHRGKRNEPAFVRFTAQVLADLKGVSIEEVMLKTTENFHTLFSKVPAA